MSLLDYELRRETPTRLFENNLCYVHPRAGIVPGAGKDGAPRVVMTMTTHNVLACDEYKKLLSMETDDLGARWTEPLVSDTMAPRLQAGGGYDGQDVIVATSDFVPQWHAASGKLLGTGHTVTYPLEFGYPLNRASRFPTYSVYDPNAGEWMPWRKLRIPDEAMSQNCSAGSTSRVDGPDGTILLPVCMMRRGITGKSAATVLRCEFDGAALHYLDHGDVLELTDRTRGFQEPSLARYREEYFLTLRNDRRGYVARSQDGLHFQEPMPWTFDDGSELGNYETQQRWVVHSDGLFLVYTRRGARNDHVSRHRAPLFMGQVDTDHLCIIRETERVLVPERGARLGNFGVTPISPEETWVTVAEWMQPVGCERYGCDGSIWVARIRWEKVNETFNGGTMTL